MATTERTGNWLTFGAVVMELAATLTRDVAPGPPDEAPWIELERGR